MYANIAYRCDMLSKFNTIRDTVYIGMYMHLCVCVYVSVCMCMYVCIYMCLYICMYAYVCVCICIYVYICISMRKLYTHGTWADK